MGCEVWAFSLFSLFWLFEKSALLNNFYLKVDGARNRESPSDVAQTETSC